jgi:hypothetical protein
MFTLIVGLVVGVLIGWNVAEPAVVKSLKEKLLGKLKG